MGLTAEQRIKQGTWEPAAMDWTSFDPGTWWQTPGLAPSWFQESGGGAWDLRPPGSSGVLSFDLNPDLYPHFGTTEGRFDPLEFYEYYQRSSPERQATIDQPYGTFAGAEAGGMWGPFEPLEIPGIPEEDLARIQQWLDEFTGAYQERLEPGFSIWDPELTARVTERASPEYTGFSPEQRGAFEENIGGQLALAKRGISEQMGQRGIRGSGLEAQLGMTAAGQAARGMGDIRAALASSDEATRTAALDRLTQMQAADEASRQWAAKGLEGVQQFATTGLQGMTTDAQNMLLNFAQMTGYPVLTGPEKTLPDPFGLTEAGMSAKDFWSTLIMNYLSSNEGGTLPDFLSIVSAMGDIDNEALQAIVGIFGATETGMLDF